MHRVPKKQLLVLLVVGTLACLGWLLRERDEARPVGGETTVARETEAHERSAVHQGPGVLARSAPMQRPAQNRALPSGRTPPLAQSALPAEARQPWMEGLIHWQLLVQERLTQCLGSAEKLRPTQLVLELEHDVQIGHEDLQRYRVNALTPLGPVKDQTRACLSDLTQSEIEVSMHETLAFEAPSKLTEQVTLLAN